MFRASDICSLTDFRQNAATHLRRLAKSGAAEVLTVNGEAKGVVMSPEVFDDLVQKAHQAEITMLLKRGMADIAAGRKRDAKEAMRAIAKKRGLRLNR